MKNNINGWLNIYKPQGVNSTKVVSIIKRYYNAKKVGHAGTLDPFAEGVLPIALGEATKTVQFCMDNKKSYDFKIKWGESTSTYDNEGEITTKSDYIPDAINIQNALNKFKGEITQTPPKYSAIKINGQRAYDLARKNIQFEIKERIVHIYGLSYDEQSQVFSVECSKGTYIRSLAYDLAKYLKSEGHLNYLKRSKVGNLFSDDSILLDNFIDKVYNDQIGSYLLAVDVVLDDIPVLYLTDTQAKLIRLGQKIESNIEHPNMIVAKNNDQLVAIVKIENGLIKPARVFNL